ncbi:MAG: adenylate/guanylate cyclase domain-containing protein [Burkholderiales bacterium]|nr:adenylate/guanylate cyclase domain-containing protein [Burkholderiales bacterium]
MTSLLGRRSWQVRGAALLLALAATLLVRWLAPGFPAAVEAAAGDLAWRIGAGADAQAESRVVVVDIDEASLREVGPWPWPRSTTAALAQRLAQAGVAVQIFDIGFAEPRDGDAQLASALAHGPTVLGQVFSLDPSVAPAIGEVAGALREPGCPSFAPLGHGAYGTTSELLAARPAVGHMTPLIEGDGVVRQLPGLVCYHDAAYASLALNAIWRVAQPEAPQAGTGALHPDWQWSRADAHGLPTGWLAPAAWLSSASVPGLVVPLDAQGQMRVPYRIARKSFVSIPAVQVLRGEADPRLLRGAMVLVGATAFGAGDVVATPLASVAGGLEVHAQVIAGLLDRRIPYTPVGATAFQVLAGLAAAVAMLGLVGGARGRAARRLPLMGLAAAGLIWIGASGLLLAADLWLPWVLPVLFVLLAASALAAGEHAQALLQRERLSAHLGAYLPRPVAQRLMSLEPTGKVQVERRDISVLVADIRNFSAFAAHRPPDATVALLHVFSTIAVDVVERHGGVVERVAGDSIVAVWNAVSPCAAHPEQALAAACELLAATRGLLAASALTTDAGPVQPLALGVGVESGAAIVGSFGPERRRTHASLGEPVSVAMRIQQMTADLSMPILVGPRLAAQLDAGRTEPLGDYLLEGLGRHYPLFVPVAWADLAPVDPVWAAAAAAPAPDRQREESSWRLAHALVAAVGGAGHPAAPGTGFGPSDR